MLQTYRRAHRPGGSCRAAEEKSGLFFLAFLVLAIAGLTVLLLIGPKLSWEKYAAEKEEGRAVEQSAAPEAKSPQEVVAQAEGKLEKKAVVGADVDFRKQTTTLSTPVTPKAAPDPYMAPPVKVNPARTPRQ